jgi:hypothetical protein
MFGKGSKIYAMITGCCPKCHKESMYLDANPFNIMKIYAMNEKCSHCKLVYQIEPSFFFGAMFVSYGLGVLIGIISFAFCVSSQFKNGFYFNCCCFNFKQYPYHANVKKYLDQYFYSL